MILLHFSDIHCTHLAFDFRDPAIKRFLGFVNLLVRRKRAFPEWAGERIVREIARTEADLVVYSGDLTTASLASEFASGRALLAPIRERWGERFFVIPGNHDRYTRRVIQRRLYEEAFPEAAFLAGAAPIREQMLGERLAVVTFDCSVPRRFESSGLFSAPLAQALSDRLELHRREGRRVILVGHYPYAAPRDVQIRHQHRLVGAELLAGVIARHKPILYLHGHKHIRWAFAPKETPDTLCVNAGSAGMEVEDPRRRAGFVVIELDDALRPVRVEARVLPTTGAGGEHAADSATAFQRLPLFPPPPSAESV